MPTIIGSHSGAFRYVLLVAFGVAMHASTIGGQARPRDAAKEARCLAVKARITSGVAKLNRSRAEIGPCDEEITALLADQWATVTENDSAGLETLMELGASVRDRRILRKAVVIATDSSKPYTIRASAVAVLGSYRHAGMVGSISSAQLAGATAWTYSFSQHMQPIHSDGRQPLRPQDFEEVDRVLESVRSLDKNSNVRLLASMALRKRRT